MRHLQLTRRQLLLASTVAAVAARPRPSLATNTPASDDPMRAAEEISRLEVIEHIPALYTFYGLMHPDAQAIIPRHVVIRYFREVFQQQHPQPAIATGVTYRDWIWGVNGVTYPGTAEVSFRQQFAHGAVEDVVRLVHDGEAWKWFFGRDRAWVDEQIRLFSQTMQVPESGEVPFGLDDVPVEPALLDRLPPTLHSRGQTARLESVDADLMPAPAWASEIAGMRYVMTREPYPVGFVQVFTVREGLTVTDAIRQEVEELQTRPPFTLHTWNLQLGVDVPFANVEMFASDAVGNARFIYWAHRDTARVGLVSHIDLEALQTIVQSLAGSRSGPGAIRTASAFA